MCYILVMFSALSSKNKLHRLKSYGVISDLIFFISVLVKK